MYQVIDGPFIHFSFMIAPGVELFSASNESIGFTYSQNMDFFFIAVAVRSSRWITSLAWIRNKLNSFEVFMRYPILLQLKKLFHLNWYRWKSFATHNFNEPGLTQGQQLFLIAKSMMRLRLQVVGSTLGVILNKKIEMVQVGSAAGIRLLRFGMGRFDFI